MSRVDSQWKRIRSWSLGARGAAHPPRQLRGCRAALHPYKSISQFQHDKRQEWSLTLLRASCLALPPSVPRHTNTPTHSSLSIPGAKTSPSRCSPAPGRSGRARRPLAHLIQAVDFLCGIHDFSTAGTLGVHCRGSRGRRLLRRLWLGAPRSRVTSPSKPYAASGQAVGRRAPGSGAGAGQEASRRQGLGCVRGGAWRRDRPRFPVLGCLSSAPAGVPRRWLCVVRSPAGAPPLPGTPRMQGARGQDAPALLLQLRGTTPQAAPSSRAEVAPATRRDVPGSGKTSQEPGDPSPGDAGVVPR
ncbi:uncharacterized protein LOC124961156 [Sciurus carolinensis]|uniref:uncharacterized protein LOC124961156 n=1 Tax=Sciurus carolinensis TaxID=30640 RepID=UPI001FB41565|nr:uncharacterized protein LOC124961156 [Sciurus carolinensis]